MDYDDFIKDIAFKPYLKYKYKTILYGLKINGKEAFLKAIND